MHNRAYGKIRCEYCGKWGPWETGACPHCGAPYPWPGGESNILYSGASTLPVVPSPGTAAVIQITGLGGYSTYG